MKTKNLLAAVLAATFVLASSSSAFATSKANTHDGFHFQLSGGLGYYSVTSDGGLNESFSGLTIPTSLLMGGTIGPVVIGGGFLFDYAGSPTYEINGNESALTDVSQIIVGLGAYADYYLNPGGGLHIQLFAGWGGLETSIGGNAGGSDPVGLVTYLGVGYDMFISEEWSAGVMGRFLYSAGKLGIEPNEISYPTTEPGVVAQLTWH